MSAPYPTQNTGHSGRNSYGVSSSDLPPMAGGGYNPTAPSAPPAQNPHFQQNPGYPSYPLQGPPQNSGYPSYPPQSQVHNPYPSALPQNYSHQPNPYHHQEGPHFQHHHHQGYNQGYPQAQEHNDAKKKKKNKGLLGQVEGLVSDVIGGGSKSHGSYGQQGHYGQPHGQQYGHVSQGHPQQQKQKGSILDSGKEMALWALEAKMMHGGMGKKMKYDMKKSMFNAVTKGFK